MASKGPIAPQAHSMVVESRMTAIDEACDQILSELEGNGFNKEDIFAIHLALGEAFINAIKHGNKMDPAKKVKIEYSVNSDKIEVSVTDEGDGFNPEVVPDPRSGKNLYKPDGRGLFLMKSYMDVVRYNQHGNCVYMVRYKEKPPMAGNLDQDQA
jgi:serine/threonine-protein kinase RsbW